MDNLKLNSTNGGTFKWIIKKYIRLNKMLPSPAVTAPSLPSDAPCRALGVTEFSPLSCFWSVVSKEMNPENKVACEKVTQHLSDEYCDSTVGCMLEHAYDEIRDAVVVSGGKAGWMRSIEHLLKYQFERKPTTALVLSGPRAQPAAPPSAELARSQPPSSMDSSIVTNNGGWLLAMEDAPKRERVGSLLARTGQLEAKATLPIEAIRAAMADPPPQDGKLHRITYNDQKLVATACFDTINSTLDSAPGDALVLEQLSKQLMAAGWLPFSGAWKKVLFIRFKNGRAAAAVVRSCHCHKNPHFTPAPGTFSLSSVCHPFGRKNSPPSRVTPPASATSSSCPPAERSSCPPARRRIAMRCSTATRSRRLSRRQPSRQRPRVGVATAGLPPSPARAPARSKQSRSPACTRRRQPPRPVSSLPMGQPSTAEVRFHTCPTTQVPTPQPARVPCARARARARRARVCKLSGDREWQLPSVSARATPSASKGNPLSVHAWPVPFHDCCAPHLTLPYLTLSAGVSGG